MSKSLKDKEVRANWEGIAKLLGVNSVEEAKALRVPKADNFPTESSYHLKEIEKGILGEASKVREETEEFLDAVEQGCKIMALVELSDLIGAVKAYLNKYHPEVSLGDLELMESLTARAFKSGRRK